MNRTRCGWTRWAGELEGPRFAAFQIELTRYNARRLQPGLPERAAKDEIDEEAAVARAEICFVESLLRAIAPLADNVPRDAADFIEWFEALEETGPGQDDPLFPWLASTATLEQMKWFRIRKSQVRRALMIFLQ
jgi:hypothetical protein